MSYHLTIPFYAFKLHLSAGGELTLPLLDAQAIRINEPMHMLAGKYAEAFQQKVLNVGNFTSLLDEYRQGNFIQGVLKVAFSEAKDRISFPAFEVEFEYYYNKSAAGYWGIVPTLGLEAFAAEVVQLEEYLQEAVRLEFARKERLQAVQDIVSAIWYEQVELQQHDILLRFPGPGELEDGSAAQQEKWLPQVAQKVQIEWQVLYGQVVELEQLSRALQNQFNRNVLLVGPSGVGKTAMVWELVHQKQQRLPKTEIWETTASILIKELTRQTGWQYNLSLLCKELAQEDVILFVRNFMELFEVGQYEGNDVSMADYLRPYLSRGEVTMISECTEEEMAQIDRRSPNFLSLFQIIRLEEPKKELEDIIIKKVNSLAHIRQVNLDSEAIKETIRLNRRFTPYAGFPGKPIRFLESLLINKAGNFPTDMAVTAINRTEVIQHFCEETGMPIFMVDPAVPMDMQRLKAQFNNTVFGQEKAVESVVNVLASVKAALTRTEKPIASFLFVGPTGVEKTELAKVLAEFMFGSRERMVRFDMSEFSSPYAVLRLIESNMPGGGLLTSAVRQEPFCVLLFDEIEKADPTFYDFLLQILDEGRLTDNRGKLVNFCSTIIIMTSNIGAGSMSNRISWNNSMNVSDVTNHFMSAVQQHFRPELFNRIDEVIPFEPLTKDTVRFVVEREIELLKNREGIQFRTMNLSIDDAVLDYLAEAGYDGKYGARQLQRTIREELVIPLANHLNWEDFDDQLQVNIELNEQHNISIEIESDPLGLDLLFEKLEKINQADHAGKLRRSIQQLQDGHFFVQLLNEISLLERKKNQQKEKFWQDKSQAQRYTYYLETRENLNKLLREIEAYETELSLACMNLQPYTSEWEERLANWEKQFFDLKIEIYTRLFPEANQCKLAIYGTNLEPILNFYLELFESKGFDFEAETLWFRESFYEETLERNTIYQESKLPYLKKEVADIKNQSFTPPAKGDLLCGIEFTVVGLCAFLYLRTEAGLHEWKLSQHQDFLYLVETANADLPIVTEIHRKNFYSKKNVRRVVEPPTIKDNLLKIDREYRNRTKGLVAIIQEVLDKQFEGTIHLELV